MKIFALFSILLFTACVGQASTILEKPVACADTDGGRDYFHAGTVLVDSNLDITSTYTDFCNNGNLIENYCGSGNYPQKEVVECECSNGACLG